MAVEPSKSDIQAIFKRLRSIPTNKQCFDCGANNPTWASVTYGVFLCIDCSAVHRSLGVHLTFIRSTQLDTSWTWLQLRAMQTGGNANATAFFRQHGCTSTDAQQKYNSRAASMYREKLHHLASKAMQTYGTKLHLDSHGGLTEANSPESKDVDFFKEHHDNWQSGMSLANSSATNASSTTTGSVTTIQSQPIPVANGANGVQKKTDGEEDEGHGPSVEHALSVSPTEAIQKQEPRKATIGARKPAKKSGLGGAKKGLGAQKVKTNFSQLEQEAQQKDKEREDIAKSMELQQTQSKEEEARKMASLKLAYKDLSLEDKKRAETAKKMDPKKAEQLERLGMAYSGSSRGASHSVTSDMQTIEQETPTVSRNTFEDRYASRGRNKDLDDDFEFIGGFSSGPPKYDSPFGLKNEDRYTNSKWGSGNENGSLSKNVIEDIPSHKPSDDRSRSRGFSKATESSGLGDSGTAQKKFGGAKAISSDMYFGKRDADFETKQTLSKFEGSASISSSDFYGGGPGSSGTSQKDYYDSGSDLSEIRDSVRQGVNKVAGRLSSIANGVISSLQDNYG